MDIESRESEVLLKESSPRRRQGLALKLAAVLCGLGLLVNLNGPMDTNIGVTFSSNKEEKKVSRSRTASTMSAMDWRNYPADIVKTVVEAENANWFFTNVYGPLAASQAAGAAPIIQAWLAGEELPNN